MRSIDNAPTPTVPQNDYLALQQDFTSQRTGSEEALPA